MHESPKRCQAAKKGLLAHGEGVCQSLTEKEKELNRRHG